MIARTDDRRAGRLGELVRLFLWLGLIGFGGPVVHIALMEEEVVRRRRWVTLDEFVDLVGLLNLIPGPNSTEMAMALGHRRAGWPGLVLAGASFITPAAIVTGVLAWLYVSYGTAPDVSAWLAVLGPAVVGLMAGAVVRLGRPVFDGIAQWVIGVSVVVLGLAGADEVLLLLLGGTAGSLLTRGRPAQATAIALCVLSAAAAAHAATRGGTPAVPTLPAIGWFFLKTGAVLYGGGYVLVALLQPLVDTYGWLTRAELVDAVAAGQITPGPVLTTATFVGYVLRGAGGAAVATVAIFLPAFLLVGSVGRGLWRVRQWKFARGFLQGVNAAALALIVVVTVTLGRTVIADMPAAVVTVGAALAAIGGVGGGWIILGGLLAGGVIRVSGV